VCRCNGCRKRIYQIPVASQAGLDVGICLILEHEFSIVKAEWFEFSNHDERQLNCKDAKIMTTALLRRLRAGLGEWSLFSGEKTQARMRHHNRKS
jgi:hypothetical protein